MRQQPLAQWSNASSAWINTRATHLCGHLAVWSETWPKSGTTLDGKLYAHPTSELATTGSEYSSSHGHAMLRTPCATDAEGGTCTPQEAAKSGRTLRLGGKSKP